MPSIERRKRGRRMGQRKEERGAGANMAAHKTHTTCVTRRGRQIPANA